MSRKRFTALVAATSTVAGCATPPATTSEPTAPSPTAQLGTVEPAYPVGDDLAPGISVIEAIPVAELSTTEPVPFAGTDLCASVPAEVVAPLGTSATPVSSDEFGCIWHGSDLGLNIGAISGSMAEAVDEHRAMSSGGSIDYLAHLVWLRVDGHYAIERILEFDRTKGCWLTLDVSAVAPMHTAVYRIDPATGEPVASDTSTSVREICPTARQVAKNLLNYIDPQQPTWWETVIHPTG